MDTYFSFSERRLLAWGKRPPNSPERDEQVDQTPQSDAERYDTFNRLLSSTNRLESLIHRGQRVRDELKESGMHDVYKEFADRCNALENSYDQLRLTKANIFDSNLEQERTNIIDQLEETLAKYERKLEANQENYNRALKIQKRTNEMRRKLYDEWQQKLTAWKKIYDPVVAKVLRHEDLAWEEQNHVDTVAQNPAYQASVKAYDRWVEFDQSTRSIVDMYHTGNFGSRFSNRNDALDYLERYMDELEAKKSVAPFPTLPTTKPERKLESEAGTEPEPDTEIAPEPELEPEPAAPAPSVSSPEPAPAAPEPAVPAPETPAPTPAASAPEIPVPEPETEAPSSKSPSNEDKKDSTRSSAPRKLDELLKDLPPPAPETWAPQRVEEPFDDEPGPVERGGFDELLREGEEASKKAQQAIRDSRDLFSSEQVPKNPEPAAPDEESPATVADEEPVAPTPAAPAPAEKPTTLAPDKPKQTVETEGQNERERQQRLENIRPDDFYDERILEFFNESDPLLNNFTSISVTNGVVDLKSIERYFNKSGGALPEGIVRIKGSIALLGFASLPSTLTQIDGDLDFGYRMLSVPSIPDNLTILGDVYIHFNSAYKTEVEQSANEFLSRLVDQHVKVEGSINIKGLHINPVFEKERLDKLKEDFPMIAEKLSVY